MKDLTIIIPMYNSEKTIKRCLDSIFKYMPNSKVVIIDDGSIDKSFQYASEYISDNISLIKKENGGVSKARNIGLLNVYTKYVMFVDSDDSVNENITELHKFKFEKNSLLIANYLENIDKSIKLIKSIRFGKYNIKDYLESFIESKESVFLQYPWGKVFDFNLIKENNLSFDTDISLGEDTQFVLRYLNLCENINIVDITLYNYFDTKNSLSKNVEAQKYLNFNTINREIINIMNNHHVDLIQFYYYRTINQTLSYVGSVTRNKTIGKKTKVEMISTFIEKEHVVDSFKYYRKPSVKVRLIKKYIIRGKVKTIMFISVLNNLIKRKEL